MSLITAGISFTFFQAPSPVLLSTQPPIQ